MKLDAYRSAWISNRVSHFHIRALISSLMLRCGLACWGSSWLEPPGLPSLSAAVTTSLELSQHQQQTSTSTTLVDVVRNLFPVSRLLTGSLLLSRRDGHRTANLLAFQSSTVHAGSHLKGLSTARMQTEWSGLPRHLCGFRSQSLKRPARRRVLALDQIAFRGGFLQLLECHATPSIPVVQFHNLPALIKTTNLPTPASCLHPLPSQSFLCNPRSLASA